MTLVHVFNKPPPKDTLRNMNGGAADAVHHEILDVIFNQDSITKAVGELAYSAAAGPDEISAILLKLCIEALKLPLHILWRKSLTDGEVSSALKLGLIMPVHKRDDKNLVRNYRPLTSHVVKILERIIVNELVAYLSRHSLFSEGQHGFRSGWSCVSQLMQHYQESIKAMGSLSGYGLPGLCDGIL